MNAAPLIAACLVLLGATACGTSSDAPSPAAVTRTAATAPAAETSLRDLRRMDVRGFHVVEKPILMIQTTRGKADFGAQVVVRLNRVPRRLRYGSGRDLDFSVQGRGGEDGAQPLGVPERRCFSNLIGQDDPPVAFVEHPVDGQVVSLAVRIGGAGTIRLRTAVHVFEGGAEARALVRASGCRSSSR